MFWRRRKAEPPAVCCYGKLPATGDFIGVNFSSEVVKSFDDWLGSSIHLARETLADGFEQAYRPALGLFIYRGEGDRDDEPERGLVGVWAASGDKAGRHYPIMVGVSYDYEQLLATGPALPIALWPFLSSAYRLVTNGRSLGVDDFLTRVTQIQPPSLENAEVATSAYHNWLEHQSMRALWETAFGSEAFRFWVMHNIYMSVEIFRGEELPATHLAIRFPLGAGDAYAASVWMDMTIRLAKWQRTVLNAFWTPQGSLVAHVGPPHVATFREIIAAADDAEHITDLRMSPSIDDATAKRRLGAELADLVAQNDLSIARFLQAL